MNESPSLFIYSPNGDIGRATLRDTDGGDGSKGGDGNSSSSSAITMTAPLPLVTISQSPKISKTVDQTEEYAVGERFGRLLKGLAAGAAIAADARRVQRQQQRQRRLLSLTRAFAAGGGGGEVVEDGVSREGKDEERSSKEVSGGARNTDRNEAEGRLFGFSIVRWGEKW